MAVRVAHRDPRACVRGLKERGYAVYAAMMDGQVSPISWQRAARRAGLRQRALRVSQAVLELCDGRYTIPMRGFSQSLNVSVAAALTLYSAMRGRPGDLGESDRTDLRARFIWLSVPEAEAVVTEQLARER